MGNKASRSKSMSDADAHDVRRRNRKNANMEAQNGGRDGGDNKHISCPDLGGAVPYKFHEDPGPDIKIHRSYANLDQSRGAPEPDIKIYRRSTGGVPKYATLPRSFGRSKSSAAGVVNGNVREFPDVGNRRSPSSEGVFRLSKRTSAASSVNSLATAPVNAGDFPDTAEVKRKLSLFEDAFARYLADKFSRLGDVIQLSLVALAVERGADGDPPGRVVTLHDYLATESVPADLLGAEYLLPVIPESLLHGIQHVRADKVSDLDLWMSLAADVVTCVAVEAANEVSRMYEYQIALLSGDAAVRIVANHAAECVMDHVTAAGAGGHLDRNSAVAGVVLGRDRSQEDRAPLHLSAVLGRRELKWQLVEVLQGPGLRRDGLLFAADEDEARVMGTLQHLTSPAHRPELYGYRGLLLQWDWRRRTYAVDCRDEAVFTMEQLSGPGGDTHRAYQPYRRLVGLPLMARYARLREVGQTEDTLAQFVRTAAAGGDTAREEVQPVYRPLSPAEEDLNFGTCNLDGADLTRAQLQGTDLSGTSVRQSRLLLADVGCADMSRLQRDGAAGADLSYSSLTGTQVDPEQLREATVLHAVMPPSQPTTARRKKKKKKKRVAPPGEDTPGTPQDVTDGVRGVDGAVGPEPGVNGWQGEEEEEEEGGWEGAREKTASPKLSDSQGNILEVEKVIEKKKKQVKEKKQKKKSASDSQGASLGDLAGSLPADEAAVLLRPKRTKRRVVSSGDVRAAPSEGAPVEVRALSGPPPVVGQGASTRERRPPHPEASPRQSQGEGRPPTGKGKTRGRHPQTQTQAQVQSHPHPAGVDRGPSPAPPRGSLSRYPRDTIAEEPPRSPGKSLSTTDIRQQPQAPHPPGRQSPPSRPGSAAGSPIDGQALYPRMSKSVSLHGTLSSDGRVREALGAPHPSYPRGFLPASRIHQMSREEIEFITRSQIFSIIKGLQIENLPSRLPERDPLLGADGEAWSELPAVAELLESPERVVTLVGAHGYGKSTLAREAAHQLQAKFVLPRWVNLLGCVSTSGVFQRIAASFGLHFTLQEAPLLYNWLNAHEQHLLLVLDDLDLPVEEDASLCDLLDDVIAGVKHVRVLVTCRRSAGRRGTSPQEAYRVGRLDPDGCVRLTRRLCPDLHEDGVSALALAVCHNPLLLRVVAATCTLDGVDPGKLFEELTDSRDHPLIDRVEHALFDHVADDLDFDTVRQMALCMLKVLDNLPLLHSEALQASAQYAASFDAAGLAALMDDGGDPRTLAAVLADLAQVGLLRPAAAAAAATPSGEGGPPALRYLMPALVRLVALGKVADDGSASSHYCSHTLERLQDLVARYLSSQCHEAVRDFHQEMDNVVDVLQRVVEREEVLEFCPAFPCLQFAYALSQLLPAELYLTMYELLAQQAGEEGDVGRQCRALCCLAHRHALDGDMAAAGGAAERALELAGKDPARAADQAFSLKTLGRVVWEEDRIRGTQLVRAALELCKAALGPRDLQTLFTNELYAWMLTERDNHQTARHHYNVSDVFLREQLDCHPLLVDGFHCRRTIWDRLSLFQRATDCAQRAVDVCRRYYGDHPRTAHALARLCDAIIKRGSLHDAIRAGTDALAILTKVRGDHEDTALSYKTMAYLMLRSGQYDEAARLGQCALDILDKVDALERHRIDVSNTIAQARYRLECKSSVFVELASRDASKDNVSNGQRRAPPAAKVPSVTVSAPKASTSITTEV